MGTRNLYSWKTRTDDGRRRMVQAQLFGNRWTVTSRCGDEEEWVVHDPPSLDDLLELEDQVSRKYQRKHAAWEHLVSVRKLIELASPEAPPES